MPTIKSNLRFLLFHCMVAVLTQWSVDSRTFAGPSDFDQAAFPFLNKHCLRCHGPADQQGEFRIDTLSPNFETELNAQRWGAVLERMNAGEMPPPDEPQPDSSELEAVTGWLGARISEGRKARMARRGPVDHYRLSREEYAFTIYDLLGVHFDPKAPGAFTPDPQWQGFERIGSQLTLSPAHVEKYLAAAERIINDAYPDQDAKRIQVRRDALDIDWLNEKKRGELEASGLAKRARTLLWPGHRLGNLNPVYQLQDAGIYRGRLKISGLAPKNGRAPHVAIYLKTLERMIFEADVLAPEGEPVILEFEAYLPAGRTDITINNEVPGPSNLGRCGQPANFIFTTLDDPKSRAPWQRKVTDDDGNPLYPLLIFDWLEWEGPLTTDAELLKRKPYFPVDEGNFDQVRGCLQAFAERAWRRPVQQVETDRYVAIVREEMEAGTTFRQAMKSSLQAILVSQNFYYLTEGSPEEKRTTLTDWELASRLSYFLWSSLPDDELLQTARDGTLHEPEVLRSQLKRMFADARIARFTKSFPFQWLQLAKVGMFPPDEKLYPDYDPWLETSMTLETTAYFDEVFQQNLPILEFLDSNWSMVNPRLTLHYHLPQLSSTEFQRVQFRPEDRRGGILTHASVLSLTSDGTRHRPVHRGVWLSETIWGETPSPPPPNIEPIEPTPAESPKATIRQKLEAHVSHASCAACHRKIDPLGFAFNNYDAIGRWQTHEVTASGTGESPPIDASGTLADGRPFQNADDFKQLVLSNSERFVEAFVEKLAVYSLRRVMTVDDQEQIRTIARQAQERGARLQDVIECLVLSDLFQMR
ncbi:DUF1592 domain-containing protein [Planctomicrobium sp. SH661]|uniref:DUF1592 domain-containing protein n=1 Tax=Planctomicrobium sp. SH661 TaxID=3448124 RepID=UPI003F5C70DC